MSFEDSEWSRRRKIWSAKWRNWNICSIFFSLISLKRRKQWRRPETFAPYMETMPSERPWQEDCFSRFEEYRFYISDTHRSGRPSRFDERLNTLVHNDPLQCRPTRELANVMNCDHSTTVRHLYSMGKVQKSGVWVPHALSKNHKNQRVAI